MKKTVLASLSMAVAVSVLAGCSNTGESSAEKKLEIVYVSPAAAVSYWVDVASGVEQAAEDLGVNVVLAGPDQVDQMKQIQDIETAVVDTPDGVITMALNPPAFEDPINYAVNNDVPVVLLDGDAPDSLRSFYVGVDTYKQGVDMGKLIAEKTDGKAQIGIVTAGLDIEIINARIDGLQSVCDEYADMEIVAIEDAQADAIVAGDKATAMMQTYPEINVMVAAGASDVPGVGNAINDMGAKDTVMGVAFNDDPQGLDYIKDGVYDYILCSLPSEEGYAAVQAMVHIVNGTLPKDAPETVALRSVTITAENVDTYKEVTPPTFDELLDANK